MTESTNRSDLVLAPGEFAYYQDTTKGTLMVNVGPSKTSLSNTDQLVIYNPSSRRLDKVQFVDQAVTTYPSAQEGQYIILSNPSQSEENSHPKEGPSQPAAPLKMGRKVNIPGPAHFPLWPGQTAEVVPGHHLHSNQYLLVRVYNEDAAKANWSNAVVKSVSGTDTDDLVTVAAPPNLTMGQLMVVKGTEISFYIPPTGIEVVPAQEGDYVPSDDDDDYNYENETRYIRDAVTLERLEYCILLSESGEKRYVPGPAVVFPEPTEGFIRDETNDSRKFRAIELSPISGIHIKVIADYRDEHNKQHHAGDELFITGKDQAIYFPREEHSIITYGDRKIYYAIAIPEGEGRYVLDRETGMVDLVHGPRMFLPDPRNQVIVRRVLDPRSVQLLYPGNTEAQQVNQQLAEVSKAQGSPGYLASTAAGSSSLIAAASLMAASASPTLGAEVSNRNFMRSGRATPAEKLGDFTSDRFNRGTTYTPPRSITLDTKYDGAITCKVWTGYAVLIVDNTGNRRVVIGPETVLLKYDENLMALELSTGTPKTDHIIRTVYLRVANNKVSDRVDAETRDLVKVGIDLSYRLNFEGEDTIKWFDVENYVKFLTDHLRSLIRNVVKRHGIQRFFDSPIDIIRDAVLGESKEGARSGKTFVENGMRIYDVEVLNVTIADGNVRNMLTAAQNDAISGSIKVLMETEGLERTVKLEGIAREKMAEADKTAKVRHQLALQLVTRRRAEELSEIEATAAKERARKDSDIALAEMERSLTDLILATAMREESQRQQIEAADDALEAERNRLDADLFVQRTEALSEKMVAAMQTLGERVVMESVTKSLAPLAVLGQTSVSDILNQLFRGGPAEDMIKTLTARPTFLNGGAVTTLEDRP